MIDIRELTIGSSVRFNDEQVKVLSITNLNLSEYGIIVKSINQKSLWRAIPESLDPIPITEELLKELGFEKNNGIGGYDYKKDYDKCAVFVTLIDDWCRFETWDEKSMKNFGNILCQHLHQAESFVYSTIKKELL